MEYELTGDSKKATFKIRKTIICLEYHKIEKDEEYTYHFKDKAIYCVNITRFDDTAYIMVAKLHKEIFSTLSFYLGENIKAQVRFTFLKTAYHLEKEYVYYFIDGCLMSTDFMRTRFDVPVCIAFK
jgi:hypothetical protein